MNEEVLERNVKIVRKNLFRQMKASLDVGNKLIDEELNGLGMLLRPIVKLFYNTLVRTDLETGTKNLINLTLKTTKDMILNGVELESDEFYQELDRIFPTYLKEDQTTRQCKKNHKNFPYLKENLKRTLKWQMIPMYRLLSVTDENVTDYHSLCMVAFPTKEDCRSLLKNQLDSMNDGLVVIEQDLSILNIATAREVIMRVLRKGFDRKSEDFLSDIDNIYNNTH